MYVYKWKVSEEVKEEEDGMRRDCWKWPDVMK